MIHLYKMIVTPKLFYASSIWSTSYDPVDLNDKLEAIQRKFVKVILFKIIIIYIRVGYYYWLTNLNLVSLHEFRNYHKF